MSESDFQVSMAQAKADLIMASYGISQADTVTPRLAKTIKGMVAYHLQQACEKMIKIQLYASGKKLNNARIYKHSLEELLIYADSISVKIQVPSYIEKNSPLITRWETKSRYDLHFVVRIDTLKKVYTEAEKWYETLLMDGYK